MFDQRDSRSKQPGPPVDSNPGFHYNSDIVRKPGEPIYLRRHMAGLLLAIVLPLIALQAYQLYVGPISLEVQLLVGAIASAAGGLILYFAFRSSARNQP